MPPLTTVNASLQKITYTGINLNQYTHIADAMGEYFTSVYNNTF